MVETVTSTTSTLLPVLPVHCYQCYQYTVTSATSTLLPELPVHCYQYYQYTVTSITSTLLPVLQVPCYEYYQYLVTSTTRTVTSNTSTLLLVLPVPCCQYYQYTATSTTGTLRPATAVIQTMKSAAVAVCSTCVTALTGQFSSVGVPMTWKMRATWSTSLVPGNSGRRHISSAKMHPTFRKTEKERRIIRQAYYVVWGEHGHLTHCCFTGGTGRILLRLRKRAPRKSG